MKSEKLKGFTVGENISVLEVLQKINLNKKGFLIVTDSDGAFLGTLYDGDIRRACIRGVSVNDSITLSILRHLNI